MKILIVDDEYLAIENMLRHLNAMRYTQIESTTSSSEAVELCNKYRFNVVFLDINMPIKNGLELAKDLMCIQADLNIIFVTAYSEYALNSYEIGVVDYIMKPVTRERLQIAFARVSERILSNNETHHMIFKFFAKTNDRISMIESDDIIYIEAHLSDSIAHTGEDDYFLGKKISELESMLLSSRNFIKVHRSCIVNFEKIDYLEKVEQSKYCIHFKGSKNVVYTSRSGAQNLREYFENFI